MDKFNFGIAKLIQFIVLVFFAFVLSFYFGSLLLIPLALLIAMVDLLSAIGFNGIFATIVAVPAIGWVCFKVYAIENLFQTLLDTGIKLYQIGIAQNKTFEEIANKANPSSAASTDESKDESDVKPA